MLQRTPTNLDGATLDTGAKLAPAAQARRAMGGTNMARRRFQTGSLFQRGKRQKVWVARWWEDVINPDGTAGRRRRAEVIGRVAELPTRRLALRVLSRKLNPINNGSHTPQSARKFTDFLQEDWMPVMLPTLKYATQKQYRYLLNVHLLPAFGQKSLCDITREISQNFLSAKLGSGLSWKTVSLLRGVLSRVMGTAEEWGYITNNLVRKTRLPRRQPNDNQSAVLTPEQIRQLVAELPEPARSLALLLVLTGLRIGELLALRWGNVDLGRRILSVKETVYDGHFDTPKSKRSARKIPIGPEAAGVLAAFRSTSFNPAALVFSTRTGEPLDRRNPLRRQLQPVCKRLGLPAITWHSLRHCHATLLDAAGAPLGTVQALLGHATPEITREVYLHAIPDDQRRAVESVERLVFGPKWTQVVKLNATNRPAIN